jgi:D-proline reductase (dithiol) PrdB
VGLIARGLERRGLPTVVVGHMLDIMRLNRPPRAAFLDFPLGHPFGRPGDRPQQLAILRATLRLFETATGPGTLVQLPFAWGEPFTFTPGQGQKVNKPDNGVQAERE